MEGSQALKRKMNKTSDFTDCETAEQVNKKWSEHIALLEEHKAFLRRLEEVQPNRMCKCGHERQWHDFHSKGECRVDAAEGADMRCECKKFENE